MELRRSKLLLISLAAFLVLVVSIANVEVAVSTGQPEASASAATNRQISGLRRQMKRLRRQVGQLRRGGVARMQSPDRSFKVTVTNAGITLSGPPGVITLDSEALRVASPSAPTGGVLPVTLNTASCQGPAPVTLGTRTMSASASGGGLHSHNIRASKSISAC